MTLKNHLCASLILVALFVCNSSQAQYDKKTRTLNVAIYLTGRADNTPAVVRALNDCKRLGAKKLVFPKGTYCFRPDSLKSRMTYISNNRNYNRCFAFDLTGMSDFEIDGQGSQFIFKGYVCPFIIERAKNISLRNFTIDFERTFHSEGHITQVTKDYMDVRFTDEYPYYIDKHENLRFVDDEGVEYPWIYLLELDSAKREIAYNAGDQWTGGVIRTTDLGNYTVRLHRQNLQGKVGNVMAFGMAFRKVPGITIKNTKHFSLHNVTMYHAGGMGVIAQYSSDLLLDSFIVKPAPGKDRILSLAADATHFVNCSGYIKMLNCIFSNQTDDATNIHGVYYRIEDILPDNQIMVRLVHQDQYGYDYLSSGLKLEFVNSQSLKTYACGKVKSAYFINDRKLMVKLSNPLPESVKKGDVIAGCGEYPSVLVRNCYIGNNRARGLLLGSRNRTLIEHNTFHTSGTAIYLEGDARGWFEQAGVRNLIIRNNTFDNCNYANWGRGLIGCGAGISADCHKDNYYNRNILIEGNTFLIHRTPLLSLYCADGITFVRNRILVSDKQYPSSIDKTNTNALFDLKDCRNFKHDEVKIE